MSAASERATPRAARALSLLAVTALLLSGCSSSVEITSTGLDDDGEAACRGLVEDLPSTLFEQESVDVSGDGIGAAWGDPAVVLTCGAPAPEEFNAWSRCSEIEGIGWFIPESQMKDFESDVVITAQSHDPRVQLLIPAEHRQKGPDTWLAALATPIEENLTEVKPCK